MIENLACIKTRNARRFAFGKFTVLSVTTDDIPDEPDAGPFRDIIRSLFRPRRPPLRGALMRFSSKGG